VAVAGPQGHTAVVDEANPTLKHCPTDRNVNPPFLWFVEKMERSTQFTRPEAGPSSLLDSIDKRSFPHSVFPRFSRPRLAPESTTIPGNIVTSYRERDKNTIHILQPFFFRLCLLGSHQTRALNLRLESSSLLAFRIRRTMSDQHHGSRLFLLLISRSLSRAVDVYLHCFPPASFSVSPKIPLRDDVLRRL